MTEASAASASSVAPTRFAGWSRWSAVGIALAALGLAAWGLATPAETAWRLGDDGILDVYLYRTIVSRVHAGDGYYETVGELLPNTSSLFHWRLPTYAWLLGSLPDPALGFYILVGLALISVFLANIAIQRRNGRLILVLTTLLLLGGTFAWSVYEPLAFYATEPWCEVLLLLSLAAYGYRYWLSGALLGLSALALRELTLPYCLVATAFAAYYRRRREVIVWAAGLGLFLVLLWLHAGEVSRHASLKRMTDVSQWLGEEWGLEFILSSCQMNVFLRALPVWIIAIYLPLALLGLAGWPCEMGRRVLATVVSYLVPFVLIKGWSYWGFFYTPLLVLGIVRAPLALRELWAALRTRQSGQVAPSAAQAPEQIQH